VKGGVLGAGVGAGFYVLSKNPASEPVVAFCAQHTTKFLGYSYLHKKDSELTHETHHKSDKKIR
jgi:hypothetical protein